MEKRQISLSVLSPGCHSTALWPLPISHIGFHPAGTREHHEAPRGRWDGTVSQCSVRVPPCPTRSLQRGTGLPATLLALSKLAKLGKASRNSVGDVLCPACGSPRLAPSLQGQYWGMQAASPPAGDLMQIYENHAILAF